MILHCSTPHIHLRRREWQSHGTTVKGHENGISEASFYAETSSNSTERKIILQKMQNFLRQK